MYWERDSPASHCLWLFISNFYFKPLWFNISWFYLCMSVESWHSSLASFPSSVQHSYLSNHCNIQQVQHPWVWRSSFCKRHPGVYRGNAQIIVTRMHTLFHNPFSIHIIRSTCWDVIDDCVFCRTWWTLWWWLWPQSHSRSWWRDASPQRRGWWISTLHGVALARPCCQSGGEWHGYMLSYITLTLHLRVKALPFSSFPVFCSCVWSQCNWSYYISGWWQI